MSTNQQVVRAWSEKRPARAGSIWTDGAVLYSYALKIGEWWHGERIVYDFRAKHFRSMTTSHHVSLATRVADKTVPPDWQTV